MVVQMIIVMAREFGNVLYRIVQFLPVTILDLCCQTGMWDCFQIQDEI